MPAFLFACDKPGKVTREVTMGAGRAGVSWLTPVTTHSSLEHPKPRQVLKSYSHFIRSMGDPRWHTTPASPRRTLRRSVNPPCCLHQHQLHLTVETPPFLVLGVPVALSGRASSGSSTQCLSPQAGQLPLPPRVLKIDMHRHLGKKGK